MNCDKIGYATYKAAIAAVVLLKRRKRDRHEYRPYKCKVCEEFHVATITKKLHTPKRLNKYPLKLEDFVLKKEKKGKKKR